MAQKPDWYTFLNISKTASLDEIKAAHRSIVMKNHPDRVRNKSDAEKEIADENFKYATEALDVLTDSVKRSAYDRGGHQAVANLKNGAPTSSSVSFVPNQAVSGENGFDFFSDMAANPPVSTAKFSAPPTGSTEQTGRSYAERRAAAMAAKNGSTATPTVTPVPTPKPVTNTTVFNDLSEKVPQVSAALKTVDIPLAALERFRDNLRDLMTVVDAAIERSSKVSAPGNKP